MSRTLSHDQARAFYDRFGALQDLQAFYENPPVRALERHADFEHARAVVEFGCGTGRFAKALFERRLGPDATYLGLDVSGRMVGLARGKLSPWANRARVVRTGGAPAIPLGNAQCDRVVSTYVLDLLSSEEAGAFVAEARRVLVPGGRLCLASLTFGRAPTSRAICRAWSAVHALRPQLVGGCRPIRLLEHLGEGWRILHDEVVCTFGVCTEVVVAQPEVRGE